MKFLLFICLLFSALNSQEKQLYTCGMHPNVLKKEAGNCPICEMDLVPVKSFSNSTNVHIPSQLQQNMGVRLTKVIKRKPIKEIMTTGTIAYDETRISHITLKYDIWVEYSPVTYIGQHVKKNEPVLNVYSPELINAQNEYLNALKTVKVLGKTGEDLLRSSTLRLKTFNISDKTISKIKRAGNAIDKIKIPAPISGVITKLNVKHGHYSRKGEMLLEIADLSKVWLIMDIYEKDLPFVSNNQDVFVTIPYDPNAKFTGKIDYIFPVIDQITRTVKARVILHNPKERLKINMMANVKISANLGSDVLAVPSEAVIKTGKRNLVIVKSKDNQFQPKEIILGIYFDGFYEVKSGLKENNIIVLSSQFMIDSESKLKEAVQKILTTSDNSESPYSKYAKFTEISLPSIQCDQCVKTIDTSLKNVNGIESVKIELENKKTIIHYNPEKILAKKLEQIIAESGYDANSTKRVESAYQNLPDCCKEDKK